MYIIRNKGIEDHPATKHGIDFCAGYAAILKSISVPFSHRSDDTPPTINLTESKVSWAGFDAFEVRWTSLAA
ncbi:hypothetical protein [Prosthecobacter sp.]|jgi:hypothetical protein|uniref:hypothetical protein n=1 Tax=Prosthecobacter sp. TaxID=1965333 RepID=UPI0037C8EDBD